MAEHKHEDLRRLFDLAIAAAPGDRGPLLDRECRGDAGLKKRIEAMIAAAEDERFLADPTAHLPASAAEAATVMGGAAGMGGGLHEGPGTRIGPYKLLQLIGEGGFGSVFMAEQEKPVARKVALKIIKLGMDTRQVIARFEAERQALAMMDHPNIARVLDAGATETGRPFFVMELVKGDPIVEYCDKNNLSIEDRLELFAQVCNAVQHAHTKGIIHRDIKPSNILVSTQDGRPHTKVIDFGIAKATASKLTEKTLFTEHKALIGTPEYMSPEQAEGSMDIDTRTDVYSLGVLLYELLTGTTPFGSKELRSAAYAEIQRIIREVEPPKPSTRISHNTDTIASVAAKRHTEPKRLGTIVRGELDWIVMKALEKDRQRRYETANGLAMDIRRYLSGEAVLAAPPSTAYRMRKFVHRHRAQVAAATLVVAALLLGLAGTAWQAKVASDQALAARKAEGEAKTARDAEKARADELKKVSDFQEKMLSQVDPVTAGDRLTEDVNRRFAAALDKAKVPEAERPGLRDEFGRQWARVNATDAAAALIDETILKPAVKAIDEQFKDQPILDARLRVALAERYRGLALYPAAVALYESALKTHRRVLGDDHRDTLQSIENLGVLLRDWGKLAEAEPYLREAVERTRRVLGEDDEGTIASIGNLGHLLRLQGKFAEAETCLREALEKSRRVLGENHPCTVQSLSLLGNVLDAQGRFAEAEKIFREALEKNRSSANITNVGYILQRQGRLAEVEPYFLEALQMDRHDLGEEHPDTINDHNNLGLLLHNQGKNAEAEPYFREVLEKRRRVLAESHPDLLMAIYDMGFLLNAMGKRAEAEPFYREVLEKRRRFQGEEHPDTLVVILALAVLLNDQGKDAEAEPLFREALDKSRRLLGEKDPQTLQIFNSLGTGLIFRGKLAEAERVLGEGVGACERAYASPNPQTALLVHHHALALLRLGRLDDAAAEAHRAMEMYHDHPDWVSGDGEAAHAATILGSILRAQGRRDEALAALREAFSLDRRTRRPGSTDLASAEAGFGFALLQHGTLEAAREAEPLLRECLEIRAKAMPASWLVPNTKSLLGAVILAIADLDPALAPEARAARLREAEPLLLDGYREMKQREATIPAQASARILEALERLVHLYEANGNQPEAAAWKAKLDAAKAEQDTTAETHGK